MLPHSLLPESASSSPPATAKRFLRFPVAIQHHIGSQLRHTKLSGGLFSQVPIVEWMRLLRLTDPVIYCSSHPEGPYELKEGQQLLLLLLQHYLDVQ